MTSRRIVALWWVGLISSLVALHSSRAEEVMNQESESRAQVSIRKPKRLPVLAYVQVKAFNAKMLRCSDPDEAKQQGEMALELCRKHLDDDHFLVRHFETWLAWHDWYTALSDGDRGSATIALNSLAGTQDLPEDQAVEVALRNCDEAEATLTLLGMPPSSAWTLLARQRAIALAYQGKPREAITAAKAGCAQAETIQGYVSPNSALSYHCLGKVYALSGDPINATRMLVTACKLRAACGEEDTFEYDASVSRLLLLALSLQDYGRADRCYTKARRLVAHTKVHVALESSTGVSRAYMYERQGRHEEALLEVDRALALPNAGKQICPCDSLAGTAVKGLILISLDRIEDARPLIKDAYAVATNHPPTAPSRAFESEVYARLLIADREYTRAKAVLESSIESIGRAFGPNHPDLLHLVEQYAVALRHLGENEAAAQTEMRHAEIAASIKNAINEIGLDAGCKPPW